MTQLNIVTYPDTCLRLKANPVLGIDDEVRMLIDDMAETMYAASGIGLAANQVDKLIRVAVIDLDYMQGKSNLIVLVNPQIIEKEGEITTEEGCLSFPKIYAPVRRPERVVLSAYDLSGEEKTYQLSGLFARAAQHELDHLDGVLFIDHLSPANRLAIKDDLAALEREFEGSRDRGLIPPDELVAARLAELEQLRT